VKKVIYIAYAHLTKKVVQDCYIDYMCSKGVVVEYWDLVTLLFGGHGEANTIETNYIFTPDTYHELERRLSAQDNNNTVYVILITYEGRFIRLFRLLSKYNCKTISIAWGRSPNRITSKLQKIVGRLVSPIRLGEAILDKIIGIAYKKMKLVKPFDVVLASGYATMVAYPDAGKIVPINSMDYDDYVKAIVLPERLVNGRYAVFLDIYLPYQKNNLQLNNLRAINPNDYFSACNHFFDIVERKFNVKVVIAAHPRSDYGDKTFEGREIYRGVTPELVKDAEFVISHNSTSLSYAVLNLKPIIFIFTNEMNLLYKNTMTMTLIYDVAAYLDANVYNIDEVTNEDHVAISSIIPERYESYKYNYLTTRDSEHTTSQEIFWREINAL
jgi:hypothetical protein